MRDFPAILQKARAGDASAREFLLNRHLPNLRAYVRLQTGKALRDKESCSDLVQSICREALRDISDFRAENEGAFRKWLYSVALRKIMDKSDYYSAQRRDAGREVSLTPRSSQEGEDRLLGAYATICTPSRDAAAREEIERIEAAFDELPPDYREVITLSCLVGLSHREIGERMDRGEEAVRMLLHRARARLARLLV